MFKIVVTIIAMLNGEPVGDPNLMTNRMSFATEVECVEFQGSEKAATAIENLKTMLDERIKPGFTYSVTTTCLPAPDDGSI